MSEIGTLKELNVQPGDVVEYVETGHKSTVTRIENGRYYGDGPLSGCPYVEDGDFRIVSRANPAETGPVRTVTRREIVPGQYGALAVAAVAEDSVRIEAPGYLNVAALRAAIATLTEIADALEDQQ